MTEKQEQAYELKASLALIIVFTIVYLLSSCKLGEYYHKEKITQVYFQTDTINGKVYRQCRTNEKHFVWLPEKEANWFDSTYVKVFKNR